MKSRTTIECASCRGMSDVRFYNVLTVNPAYPDHADKSCVAAYTAEDAIVQVNLDLAESGRKIVSIRPCLDGSNCRQSCHRLLKGGA